MFYKVSSNIDAYPFIFDPKLTDTDEKFIENLEALSGTCSAIELLNIKEEKLKTLIPEIKKRQFKMAFISSFDRWYI